jgi:hypothetical protein
LLAHGLIRGSFVPPEPIQEMRDLTRTRKQLTREIVQHLQRIEAVLEEANVKLSYVIADTLGLSGWRILKAMIAGERDGRKLAALGSERLSCTRAALAEALTGHIRDHTRILVLNTSAAVTQPKSQLGLQTESETSAFMSTSELPHKCARVCASRYTQLQFLGRQEELACLLTLLERT